MQAGGRRFDPDWLHQEVRGGIAQLGEQLLCKQKVVGSIPSTSTKNRLAASPRGEPTGLGCERKHAVPDSSREITTLGTAATRLARV